MTNFAMSTRPLRLALLLAAFNCTLSAETRTSTHYRLATETVDAGGTRHVSASYTNDGSTGGITGLSTVASPAGTAKAGYIGQLYQAVGLSISAAPASVNEAGTRQLSASLLLDDATTLALDASAVNWSVVTGPIVGISAGGLVTAGPVALNGNATVQGLHSGFTGTLNLAVLNVTTDDFGDYANDGLPDEWQVLHYGLNNPDAAPGAAPDGTGETNLFKYTAGLIPFDPSSRFTTNLEPISGQPGFFGVVFGPLVAGRIYVVQYTDNLITGTWTTLSGGTTTDSGNFRTVTDPTALGTARFYRVKITLP